MSTKEHLNEIPTETLKKMAEDAFSNYYALATKPCGNWQPDMEFTELEESEKRLNDINEELEKRYAVESSISLEEKLDSAGKRCIETKEKESYKDEFVK